MKHVAILFLPALVSMTACEMLENKVSDSRDIEHNCVLITPEGSRMECNWNGTTHQEDAASSTKVDIPVPMQ